MCLVAAILLASSGVSLCQVIEGAEEVITVIADSSLRMIPESEATEEPTEAPSDDNPWMGLALTVLGFVALAIILVVVYHLLYNKGSDGGNNSAQGHQAGVSGLTAMAGVMGADVEM